jgi:hypothetical protein
MGNSDNPRTGSNFEEVARRVFLKQGVALERNFSVPVGAGRLTRPHRFDLGCQNPPTLVECKAHTWTEGGNAPSAKLSVWNEAMYYFLVAPAHYRKVLFVLADRRGEESLAQHYIKRYGHLIPAGVEIWEYDPCSSKVCQTHRSPNG